MVVSIKFFIVLVCVLCIAPMLVSAADPGGLVPCTGPKECNFDKFLCMIDRIVDFLIFKVAVPVGAIFFAYAGWLYMSAGGNEGKVTAAHEAFGSVFLGIVIALGAWLFVNALLLGLSVKDAFNFLNDSTGCGLV